MVKNIDAAINTISDMMIYLGHISNHLKGGETDRKLIIETFLAMLIHLVEIIEIPEDKLALTMMDKAREYVKDASTIDKLQLLLDIHVNQRKKNNNNNGEARYGDA